MHGQWWQKVGKIHHLAIRLCRKKRITVSTVSSFRIDNFPRTILPAKLFPKTILPWTILLWAVLPVKEEWYTYFYSSNVNVNGCTSAKTSITIVVFFIENWKLREKKPWTKNDAALAAVLCAGVIRWTGQTEFCQTNTEVNRSVSV
jgi:hypothetical protein